MRPELWISRVSVHMHDEEVRIGLDALTNNLIDAAGIGCKTCGIAKYSLIAAKITSDRIGHRNSRACAGSQRNLKDLWIFRIRHSSAGVTGRDGVAAI